MAFYSSQALNAARSLPDRDAAAFLVERLSWDSPDEDHFMDLALLDPDTAEAVFAKIAHHPSVLPIEQRYHDALNDGRAFRALLASTEQERDAAAVLAALLPTDSSERIRHASLLVLAELRLRPVHAATLALTLWKEPKRLYTYWLKDLIYHFGATDPPALVELLRKLWALWHPTYCQYYFTEGHDTVCALCLRAIETGDRAQLAVLPFLLKYRGWCDNDRETLVSVAHRLDQIAPPLRNQILDTLLAHAHRHDLFDLLLPAVAALPEPARTANFWRLARRIQRSTASATLRSQTRKLQRLVETPELRAFLAQQRLRIAAQRIYDTHEESPYAEEPNLELRWVVRLARRLVAPWPPELAPLQTKLRRKVRRMLAIRSGSADATDGL